LEKEDYFMFALVPKCCILKSSKNENNESLKKMKNVSFRLNNDIEFKSYKSCLEQSSVPIIGKEGDFIVVESDPSFF
jgi:hypothetical protein